MKEEDTTTSTSRRLSDGIQSLRPPTRLGSHEQTNMHREQTETEEKSVGTSKASPDAGNYSLQAPRRNVNVRSKNYDTEHTSRPLTEKSHEEEDIDFPVTILEEKGKNESAVSALTTFSGGRHSSISTMDVERQGSSTTGSALVKDDGISQGNMGANAYIQKCFLPATFLVFAIIGLSIAGATDAFSDSTSPATPVSPQSSSPAPSQLDTTASPSVFPTPAPTPLAPSPLRTRHLKKQL